MSKAMFAAMVLTVGVWGCGADPDVAALGAEVRIDAQVASQVDRVSVYVLGPKMSDGKFLPCSLLRLRTVEPTSNDVDLLASREEINFPSATGSATVGDIPAGQGRLVYVEAYGGTNVIGNGCKEQVEVKSGETKSVSVTVYLWP
mgnify:CR=1 FL=1